MGCCGDSGGSSGSQKFEWNEDLAPLWRDALTGKGGAKELFGKEYDNYANSGRYGEQFDPINTDPSKRWSYSRPGQRIADMNEVQRRALADMNMIGAQGSTMGNTGRQSALDTMGGDYLTGDQKNPYAGFENTVGANQYMGDSPQFQQMMGRGMDKIVQGHQLGTAANTNRMAALSGAFGGSAHQQMMQNDAAGLDASLGDYAGKMQNDQWNRSANLREADIGRRSDANRFALSSGQQSWENERARQAGLIPGLMGEDAYQMDLRKSMLGAGDAIRGNNQQYIDLQQKDWENEQNWGGKQLEFLTGMLSRGQGGMSPNSYTTQSMGGISPLAGFLGGMGAMKGMNFF